MLVVNKFIIFCSIILSVPVFGAADHRIVTRAYAAALAAQPCTEDTATAKLEFFDGNHSYMKRLMPDIAVAGAGAHIHVDSFVVTNKLFMQALIDARDRGAQVRVNIDSAFPLNKKAVKHLKEEGIAVSADSRNHNKRVLIQTALGKKITYLGSANSSYNAYHNSEVMMRLEDDMVYDQCRADHALIAGSPDRPEYVQARASMEIDTTPMRPTAVSSASPEFLLSTAVRSRLNFDLIGAAAKMPATSPEEDPRIKRSMRLATMNFTDSPIKHELVQLAQDKENVSVLVDGSTLHSQDGLRHLEDMNAAGVQLFVYNPYGAIRRGAMKSIGHKKMLIRQAHVPEKNLVVISTKNLTVDTGDFNSAVLIPGDAQAVEDAAAIYDGAVGMSVPYEAIDWKLVPSVDDGKRKRFEDSDEQLTKRARIE